MSDLSALLDVIRRDGGTSRRTFLAYGAALASVPWLGERAEGARVRRASFASDPFTLGVASGDPSSSGVVLWTRLAPKPLEPGGGMPAEIFEVQYEIADDEAMKHVVKRGTAVSTPQLGHSVHVEAEGLKPDRWYWYRFKAGDAESKVARTRTLPDRDAKPDSLKFAFASCQHYEAGLYTAYQHMAKDELDLIFHLGDYIYDGAGKDGAVRKHVGKEVESLEDYRLRYCQYHADPLLQAIHARCPWFVTWDDHEVGNNYAGLFSQDAKADPVAFLAKRANAYQAYYEMMPLRKRSLPHGPDLRLYRDASYGRLAEFLILDTRQYRTDQPNGDKASPLNAAALDPKGTILGKAQSGWLKSKLLGSAGTWNVLAQQVMMGMVDFAPGDAEKFSMDHWTGYAHERIELMKFLAERQVPNPVFLAGDIHSAWVNDVRVDDRDQKTPVVATEFVGTSISSSGNGVRESKRIDDTRAENPFVKFISLQRGYVRCTVTPDDWRSDYVVVEDVSKPGAPAVNRASFVVEAGRPGAQKA
jgi:alkaline phosphatase D